MEHENNLRIDKWLWAVRIFKTRSMATNACKKDHVIIDEIAVKPSRLVKTGEIVMVKKKPIIRSYKVKGLLGKRMSAKIVVDYVEDITPKEELQKLEMLKIDNFGRRPHGAGRPTKKERRTIDKLKY